MQRGIKQMEPTPKTVALGRKDKNISSPVTNSFTPPLSLISFFPPSASHQVELHSFHFRQFVRTAAGICLQVEEL